MCTKNVKCVVAYLYLCMYVHSMQACVMRMSMCVICVACRERIACHVTWHACVLRSYTYAYALLRHTTLHTRILYTTCATCNLLPPPACCLLRRLRRLPIPATCALATCYNLYHYHLHLSVICTCHLRLRHPCLRAVASRLPPAACQAARPATTVRCGVWRHVAHHSWRRSHR